MRIRDFRINQYKFRICDLRTGTLHKFADLRLRKEPKNLRICNLRTNKKVVVATFAIHTVHSHTQVPMNKYGYRIGTRIFALEYTIQDTDTDLKPLHILRGLYIYGMSQYNPIQISLGY